MTDRIRQIDAARGVAMLFVFISHFGLTYFHENGATTLDYIFERVGMVATPTFMIISGIMLGYLYQVKKENSGSIRDKLRDRGLFFLVVGHCIIALAHIPRFGSIQTAFSSIFITDTIGVCILFGPLLMDRLKPTIRMLAGGGIYLMSWVSSLYWTPGSLAGEVAKFILIGSTEHPDSHVHLYTFPLLPWFGLYLMFTILGEKIGKYHGENNLEEARGLLRSISLRMISVAVLVWIVSKTLKIGGVGPTTMSPLWATFYPFQKLPPGPVYIMFFGGVGLWIMYALFRLPDGQVPRKCIEFTSLLGQTSFFVFVVQYYVYYVLIYCSHLKFSILWPFHFLGSVLFISILAGIWHTKGYNRFLTLRWNKAPAPLLASDK